MAFPSVTRMGYSRLKSLVRDDEKGGCRATSFGLMVSVWHVSVRAKLVRA